MRNRSRVVPFVLALLALAVLTSCSPMEPTPVASPATVINVTIPGDPNCVVINGNGCNTGTPASPSPGPFVKPDYVKVTQFGETCPTGTNPSGQDRAVRVGCNKAITCSPKCKQGDNLPDIDCPIPQGAEPDSFEVISGKQFIAFSSSGSNPGFNRNAVGLSPGLSLISCTYAGVVAQSPFDLTVIP